MKKGEAWSTYSAHVLIQEKARPLIVTLKNLGRAQGCRWAGHPFSEVGVIGRMAQKCFWSRALEL